MRRSLIVVTLAGVLLSGWALPAAAQQNGIVIQNNGVDSTNSAAGADNVRISHNPGNAQSASAGGVNNEDVRAVREPKERDRSDREARKNAEGGGEAAPVEAAAAPAEGDLQAYAEGGEYADPAAAPVEVAQPVDQAVVALPSTGSGVDNATPISAALAGIAALAAGATSMRRRLTG